MDSSGCFLDSCCTYLEDAVYDDLFIYIVDSRTISCERRLFLLLVKEKILLLCYIK